MISISLGALVSLYVVLILSFVGVTWWVARARRRRHSRRVRRNVIVCLICRNVYEDDSEAKVLRCPSCGSLNERSEMKEI